MTRKEQPVRPLARISMSLPAELLEDVDKFVDQHDIPSRSHAIALMLSEYLVNNPVEDSNEVAFGTITLHYYNNMYDLQRQLAELQYHHINEVISSVHVQLVRNQLMEVILVQGPAAKLRQIADEFTKMRGVILCRLQVIGAIIPPLHPLPAV